MLPPPKLAATGARPLTFPNTYLSVRRALRDLERAATLEELYDDADVLVFGHSHIPWDTTADTGLRLLNPGSPTDRRRQPFCTYMTLTASAGEIADVELHRLPPRASRR